MAKNIYLLVFMFGWCLVGVIVYGSLSPSPITQDMGMDDKFQHFFAYFVTMAWFAQLYGNSKQLMAQGAFLVILAVCLEFAQLVGGERVYEPADIVASVVGVFVGIAVPKTLLDRLLLSAGLIDRPLRATTPSQ